jgi:DNA repair protein RadA/Sms
MIIDRIWLGQEGAYFFLATKSASKQFKEHAFARKDVGKVAKFLEDHKDKDIYFCPHGFTHPIRRKEYAVLPKMLWADLDEVDPRKVDIKPTIAIESSPGRYVGLWLTDKIVTEELNRKLTYHLDADHGGWDLTQVLRVPGTLNYKYANKPRVKTMWDSYPAVKISEVKKKFIDDDDGEQGGDTSAADILEKYGNDLAPWVRRELMTQNAPPGKRSEMIWKLENALLEAGLTKDEAFTLIKGSAWNKFKGRRSEDEQLKRELDKIVNERMKAGAKVDSKKKLKYLSQSMEDIEMQEVEWIWYPILARGQITIIEGDPGGGKSYLTQMICKCACDNELLPRLIPGRSADRIKGTVAYFDMENSADTVTKKRLYDNGMVNMKNFYQEEEPFSWADTERMNGVFEALERVKPCIVVFDTMNTYLGGKVDTGRANSSQEAMFPLREIAQRFNCAVVVIRHLVKAKKDKTALAAGQGSIAFAGFVRIVATVGKLPDDPDIGAIAVTKCNLAPMPKDVLTFEIKGLPDTKKEKDRSKFEWGELVSGVYADDIIKSHEKNTDKEDAVNLLKTILDEQDDEDVKKLEVMAEKKGISRRTLHRAADTLGVVKTLKGFGKNKQSFWSLP